MYACMHIPVLSKHIKCNQFMHTRKKKKHKPMKENAPARKQPNKKVNKICTQQHQYAMWCSYGRCVHVCERAFVVRFYFCYRFRVEFEKCIDMLTAYRTPNTATTNTQKCARNISVLELLLHCDRSAGCHLLSLCVLLLPARSGGRMWCAHCNISYMQHIGSVAHAHCTHAGSWFWFWFWF